LNERNTPEWKQGKKFSIFALFFAGKNGFAPQNGITIKNEVGCYLRYSWTVFEQQRIVCLHQSKGKLLDTG
jgi:hypothetical protein